MPAIKRTNRLNKRQLIAAANEMFRPITTELEPNFPAESISDARRRLLIPDARCRCGCRAEDIRLRHGEWKPECYDCRRGLSR